METIKAQITIPEFIKGEQGAPGKDGKDGISATHSWEGTTLTITSAVGTSSANLKGEKGDKGDTGKTAYQYAVEGGYTGTEAQFSQEFANAISATYIASVVDEKLGVVENGTY